MKPSVRQAGIFEFVERKGSARVEDLALRFSASLETVRRDLSVLARAGRVRKVHGGAVRAEVREEGSFEERLAQNTQAKREIAEKLVRLIPPGSTLAIDTGTTTALCAEALIRVKGLQVVTNSVRVADVLSRAGTTALLIGGRYRPDNAQTVGAQTCAEIARYRPDRAILTVGAMDTRGAYDFSEDEAHVARAMIETAQSVIVVADTSKSGRSAPFQICEWTEVAHLVIESPLDEKMARALADAGTECV